jgi:acetyl-CoA carboxylase carboxyl transferase subunit beta
MEPVFTKCRICGYVHDSKKFKRNCFVCDNCKAYNQMPYKDRIDMLADKDSFHEINHDIAFHNPLKFPGYEEKYKKAATATNLKEAVVTGKAKIDGIDVMLGVMDSRFMMASMGVAVGYKISSLFEEALNQNKPVIIFSASGGARMQEGLFALMQMARTAAAVQEFSEAGGYYISVLTNPTTGGVSASFAFLGDTILAEPNALIGFAGKRVIKQTIGEELPEGFQTAEYLLEHGFIDSIVKREHLREKLAWLLKFHRGKKRMHEEAEYARINNMEEHIRN